MASRAPLSLLLLAALTPLATAAPAAPGPGPVTLPPVYAPLPPAGPPNLGGYTSSSSAKTASLTFAKNVLAALNSSTPICALGVTEGHEGSMGTIFGRVMATSPSMDAIHKLPINGTMMVPASDLEGPLPWLLSTWMQYATGVQFRFMVVKLDPHTSVFDRAALTSQLFQMFPTVDCALEGLTLSANNMANFHFTSPFAGYGYLVLTHRAHQHEPTMTERIFLWTTPYTWQVWVLLISILLWTAGAMALLDIEFKERKNVKSDFLPGMPMHRQAAHFVYLSTITFTGHGMFRPASAAGRFYACVKAFCLLILWSCYAASLTAIMSEPEQPEQTIRVITDFLTALGTGMPACITAKPEDAKFMATAYPTIRTMVLPTLEASEVAEAVENGTCVGAVLAQDDLNHAIGYEDASAGKFCALKTTGDFLGHFFRVIPFNPTSRAGPPSGGYEQPPWLDGVFRQECYATENFNFSVYKNNWFPTNRPACAAKDAYERHILTANVPAVGLPEVGGIFLIQALGAVLAMAVHFYNYMFPSTADHDQMHHINPEEALHDELEALELLAKRLHKRKDGQEQTMMVMNQLYETQKTPV